MHHIGIVSLGTKQTGYVQFNLSPKIAKTILVKNLHGALLQKTPRPRRADGAKSMFRKKIYEV